MKTTDFQIGDRVKCWIGKKMLFTHEGEILKIQKNVDDVIVGYWVKSPKNTENALFYRVNELCKIPSYKGSFVNR